MIEFKTESSDKIFIKMEEKLLRQEEEFHRFNAQLELKTSALIKEVETVMSMQEHLTASAAIDYNYERSPCRSEGGSARYDEISDDRNKQIFSKSKEFDSQSARSGSWNSLRTLKDPSINNSFKEDIGDDNFFCGNKRSLASDAMIRVLQSKVKVLQSEVNTLRLDYRKKVDECHKSKNSIKHLEEEKNRALSQISIFREQLNQRQTSASAASAKLRQKETENASLKKEIENLKKEIKSMSQAVSTNDVRLNRALEEVDKLKNALKMSTLQEKELQLAARRSADHMSSVVKKLEKQKAELLHSFRKQVQLIENLKSQKVAYEASIMSKFTEEKFFELLDSGASNHSLRKVK